MSAICVKIHNLNIFKTYLSEGFSFYFWFKYENNDNVEIQD